MMKKVMYIVSITLYIFPNILYPMNAGDTTETEECISEIEEYIEAPEKNTLKYILNSNNSIATNNATKKRKVITVYIDTEAKKKEKINDHKNQSQYLIMPCCCLRKCDYITIIPINDQTPIMNSIHKLALYALRHKYTKKHKKRLFEEKKKEIEKNIFTTTKKDSLRYNIVCSMCNHTISTKEKSKLIVSFIQHQFTTEIHNKKELVTMIQKAKDENKEIIENRK